jgi:hypothetical protein
MKRTTLAGLMSVLSFAGILTLISCVLLAGSLAQAQRKTDRKDLEGAGVLRKPGSILDRAGGAHTKSNIGSFFENRGKLYAQSYAQGPTFEWPIGSAHEFVYRANPFVAIPGNVIQGRYYNHSEWESAAGYHNRDSAQVAFSDKPYTWPAGGWHLKDSTGKPVFVSDQDSYCVYNDSMNTISILNIQMNQTGYAFSQKNIRDMVFYIFEVTNFSNRTYDSVYFGMYADISCGGSDDVEDYGHRRMVFDKSLNRLYLYKSTGVSYQWTSAPAGYFGVVFLQTPKISGVQAGITDWHYNLYADDKDQDFVQFGLLASAPALYNDPLGPKYFHLGANAPNLHYDDPATISADGADAVSTMGSGPYRLAPGDTLRFITAWIAGNSAADMDLMTARAYNLLASGFVTSKPPDAPHVTAVAGNGRVSLAWDNRAETSRDPLSNTINFEGYHLYKSADKGQHWDLIDRNAVPAGPDPVPLATFDRKDGVGQETGLQYSYVDSSVTNGFEYWYSVTGYTTPDVDNNILESSLGRKGDVNVGVAVPRSNAIARTPVRATPVQKTGNGTANVVFSINALDIVPAGGKTLSVHFGPSASMETGTPHIALQAGIDSVGARTSDRFGVVFTSATQFVVRNLTQGTVTLPSGSFLSGVPITFEGIRLTLTTPSSLPEDQPQAGDSVVVQPGIQVDAAGPVNVLPLQAFDYGVAYATSNGVVLTIRLADTLAQSRITYRDQFQFSTLPAAQAATTTATDLDRVKVVPNPYLVSSRYEEEFGILRKEPLRQLKFNNLPARCTITIFTIAGDKVQTIEHNSDNGTETWDMRTSGNREIAPGVYLYLVKTDQAEKLGRFAVVK